MRKQEIRTREMRKSRAQRIRKARQRRRAAILRFLLAAAAVAAVVCVLLLSGRNVANAEESGSAVPLAKYYKTITIHRGDTLWSIAEEYQSGAYQTVQDYIRELKSMNNLHSEQLKAGMKLTVAYFEKQTEQKVS